MASQLERIASLETHRTWHWIALSAVTLGAIAWLTWISLTLVTLKGDVQAIKQKIKDDGLGDIVSKLQSPSSPEELKANLTAVSAQIQIAKVEKKIPNRAKVDRLSQILAEVADKHPDLPDAWQAATYLVDYKFESRRETAPLPNCLNLPPTGEKAFRGNKDGTFHETSPSEVAQAPIQGAVVVAQNCQLNLDDDGTFNSTQVAKDFRDAKEKNPRISFFILSVTNAHITYSGGKLIPIGEIQFVNCSFEIKPTPALPNKESQSITMQLLAATSPNGTIWLPSRA